MPVTSATNLLLLHPSVKREVLKTIRKVKEVVKRKSKEIEKGCR